MQDSRVQVDSCDFTWNELSLAFARGFTSSLYSSHTCITTAHRQAARGYHMLGGAWDSILMYKVLVHLSAKSLEEYLSPVDVCFTERGVS